MQKVNIYDSTMDRLKKLAKHLYIPQSDEDWLVAIADTLDDLVYDKLKEEGL